MHSTLRRHRILLASTAAIAALGWTDLAAAQTAQADDTTASQQGRSGAPESVQDDAAAIGPVTVGSEDVQGSEIVVTGSRIRGAAPVGSTVIAVDRRAIEASGAVTTDRLLKEIPQVFDLGTSENSRGQSGGNSNITFGNSINIRGIGPYATLTILDGHRVVNNSRSVDPSIIPSLGLERVEVVADGASAVYGSDAIAGVVNLIPRRTLNGVETIGRMGFANNFQESQFGVAAGKTGDWGQVMLAYEHVSRSNLSGDDRDFFTSDLNSSSLAKQPSHYINGLTLLSLNCRTSTLDIRINRLHHRCDASGRDDSPLRHGKRSPCAPLRRWHGVSAKFLR